MKTLHILVHDTTTGRDTTMKKRTLSAGVLTAMMLISPVAGNTAEASTLANASALVETSTQKVMWGANELADTQIGRIVFLKDTKLYKRVGNNPVEFHLNAKKGSMWRVHKITKEGNMNVYDLGGGVRVQQSNLSKYEAVPTALIEKQVKENGAHISWVKYKEGFSYPQVRRLASKDVEDKINNSIESMYRGIAQGVLDNGYGHAISMDTKILGNKDNRFEVRFTGMHEEHGTGRPRQSQVEMIFNISTGERYIEDN